MPLLLSEYVTQTRDILKDPRAAFYSAASVKSWINRARSQCAQDNQCVRYMPASWGSVLTATVTNPGSGYSAATLTVTGPDAQGGSYTTALLTAVTSAGLMTSVIIANAGSGYIDVPTVTVDGDGAGAEVVVTLTPHLATVAEQETYTFAAANAVLDEIVGLKGIIGVQGISVSWGALRPTLSHIDFSSMQAYLRAQSIGMMNFPSVWAQYGQGSLGSVYLWPRPAQVAQMEWDCYCDVLPLVDDTSVDLIPGPWDQSVPFYAAYLAYLYAQRFDDARMMLSEFKRMGLEARTNATPSIRPSMYQG